MKSTGGFAWIDAVRYGRIHTERKSGSQTRADCYTNSSIEGHHLFQGLFGRNGCYSEAGRYAGGSVATGRVTKPDRCQHRSHAGGREDSLVYQPP